jgi:hypothetical protein
VKKEQLLMMADWKLKKLWRAMSNNQKQWYRENKLPPIDFLCDAGLTISLDSRRGM